MTKVRTRIAPSPTGDPHVGTAYIALFNYCFAKSQGGDFILRIEDTDQERSTPESEKAILDSLRWLGMSWSEGPDVGGEFGPYRQSERTHIYGQYVQQLLDKGHAFYCFCTPEELDSMRKEQMAQKLPTKYDGRALKLSPDEVKANLDAGKPYVIRMKVPETGVAKIADMLRDDIEIEWNTVDMQILVKSDGMPTYHLANVVDDHLMGITHVIRGEEWISSAPKHILLYEYFGWQAPVLCHMPLLRNPDKSKLSKRKNPTSITYYERMGYMPEALLNYLGMMGWTMPNGQELFTIQEMINHFDISRVSLGGPVFDVAKLTWLNGRWIREQLDDQQFVVRLSDWAFKENYINAIVPMVKARVETFGDVAPLAGFLFSGTLDIKAEQFEHKKLNEELTLKLLQLTLWRLEALRQWDKESIYDNVQYIASYLELKIRDYLFPLFIAIAGTSQSTSVLDSMSVLGPDMSRARLRHAIVVLGGLSKKQQKTYEDELNKIQS